MFVFPEIVLSCHLQIVIFHSIFGYWLKSPTAGCHQSHSGSSTNDLRRFIDLLANHLPNLLTGGGSQLEADVGRKDAGPPGNLLLLLFLSGDAVVQQTRDSALSVGMQPGLGAALLFGLMPSPFRLALHPRWLCA